jgi:exodeoxyribonuclease V alpha subunit
VNFKGGDFYFIEREEPQQVLDTIKHLVSTHIPKRFGVHPIRDIQVLTPMYKGVIGITNLNAELQKLLNPEGEVFIHGAHRFRIGDKVMQTRNNYELEVFNGDIGLVEGIERITPSLFVRYDNRVVRYELSDLNELVLAYACSVHKAQGNEYPAVVLPIHLQHYIMLQRNLLYTGITRGKRLVVLVGSKKALAIAIKNNKIERRFTCLKDRLREY